MMTVEKNSHAEGRWRQQWWCLVTLVAVLMAFRQARSYVVVLDDGHALVAARPGRAAPGPEEKHFSTVLHFALRKPEIKT